MINYVSEFVTNQPPSEEVQKERNRRLDATVQLWLIYSALEYAGAPKADEAHTNYLKAWQRYKELYTGMPDTALRAMLDRAKAEAYYGSFARNTLGANTR